MYKNNVKVEIITDNGNRFTEYRKDEITYIESREGSNYSIKINNNSNKRLEALITVDGLDVIKGTEASFKNRGYIIDTYSSIIIPGYRINDNEVRRFSFGKKNKNNYVAKTNNNINNTGVIGIAIFEECRVNYRYSYIVDNKWKDNFTIKDTSKPRINWMTFSTSSSITPDHGTNMGKVLTNKVTTTHFNRLKDTPIEIFTFQYRSKQVLKNMGFIIHSNYEDVIPSAFPGESSYCKQV